MAAFWYSFLGVSNNVAGNDINGIWYIAPALVKFMVRHRGPILCCLTSCEEWLSQWEKTHITPQDQHEYFLTTSIMCSGWFDQDRMQLFPSDIQFRVAQLLAHLTRQVFSNPDSNIWTRHTIHDSAQTFCPDVVIRNNPQSSPEISGRFDYQSFTIHLIALSWANLTPASSYITSVSNNRKHPF